MIAVRIKTRIRPPTNPPHTKNPNAINVKIAEQYTTAEHRPKAVVNAIVPILRKFSEPRTKHENTAPRYGAVKINR